MSEFVIEAAVNAAKDLAVRHYPMPRANELKRALALLFSRHLGRLLSGAHFEAEWILVTGRSGSGKTTEIRQLLDRFNRSQVPLPSGRPAKIVPCMLDGVTGWKAMGAMTLRALGYPLSASHRHTQAELWSKVRWHAREQGVVGIYFDEAQHALRGKSETERAAVLDSYKTLLKSADWPMMLILSGVPELEAYVADHDQLLGKRTMVEFADIDLPQDFQAIHELVSSYALTSGMKLAEDLQNADFYERLTAAAASRWGLLIDIVASAVMVALEAGMAYLDRESFVSAWVARTGLAPGLTPYLNERYKGLYSSDRPFWVHEAKLRG